MRSLLMLLIGAALSAAVLTVNDVTYVHRIPRDETPAEEIYRWIERDNCQPVLNGRGVSFYRCPRLRF